MSLRLNPDLTYRLKTSLKILALLAMVEIWALVIMFGIRITSMYVFSQLETLPKAPVISGIITLAKSIYLLTYSFPYLTILWFWGIVISTSYHFLSPTTMPGLLCFILVLISICKRISIPVCVIVCGNGTGSYQFLVTFI